MPYQVNGQAVVTKSQRLSHGASGAAEAGAAAGGGAFVTMSAAVAALNGAAMSSTETPTTPSEIRSMVFSPLKVIHCSGNFRSVRGYARGRSRLLHRFSASCCNGDTVESEGLQPDRSMSWAAVPRQSNEAEVALVAEFLAGRRDKREYSRRFEPSGECRRFHHQYCRI